MIQKVLIKMGLIEKDLIETDLIQTELIKMDLIEVNKKIIQAIRENPWNIYYVSEVFRNKYSVTKECVKSDPNTYQNAALHLKQNVNLAIIFLEQGGSLSLISKHLRNIEKVGMIAVKINPNSFQFIGKSLNDDDDTFKFAFNHNEKILRYASERLRKINIQS